MQVKRVKCPNCGVVLDVKNSKNETQKQITCPQCESPLQVNFAPKKEPLIAETYYAPKHLRNEGATQLAIRKDKSHEPSLPKEESHAELVYQGHSYLLSEGLNVIGRSATSSMATIQIQTDDRYMSRQHATIEINTLPDGTIKAVLSNYKNKNQTTINAQVIETGDKIKLEDGNTITMGKTTVVFKLS